MMTPSETDTSVGVPQPIFAIGPIRKVPCFGGKITRRSLMIRGAFSITFVGNRIPLIAPVRTPAAIGSSSIPRLSPSRPPTPMRVKP
jgi:hypothetical protein